MKKNKYPIEELLLHKKCLGKNTLSEITIKATSYINGYAGICYHYTSASGLKGILDTRTLFFTDCQYLNDYRERVNINDSIEEFWSKNKGCYDKDFYKLLIDFRLENYEDNQFSYMESDITGKLCEEPSKYFVLSASDNSDSLSMWKYYSKSGQYDGYCIGLATYALSDEWIDRDTGVAIEEGNVIYYNSDKQDIIHKAIDVLYLKWCTYKISEKLNEKIKKDYISWISIMSLFFKDEAFANEEEYRFVAVVPIASLKTLKYDYDGTSHNMFDFRISNGLFIPYIKMPFYYWNKDCWVIHSIGIAPSTDTKLKRKSLEQYIQYRNYIFPDLSIYDSKIPLRY